MTEQFDYTTYTRQGQPIHIRRLQPADAPLLIEIFEHMSYESRYSRFSQTLTNPDPVFVQRTAAELADVTPDEGVAWIAFIQDEDGNYIPVGGARYIFTAPDEAEVSVAVRDDYQRQGIGTALLLYVGQQAREAGLKRLVALIEHANRPLWAVLERIPVPFRRQQQGPQVLIEIDLSTLDDPPDTPPHS